MEDILLVSQDYIRTNSMMSNNLEGKYLLTAIREAQIIDLQSTIGTKLLESLLAKVSSGDITKPENVRYKELLDNYVQDFLLYSVLANVVIPVSFKVNNFGTATVTDDEKMSSYVSKLDYLKQYYTDKRDFIKLRMQDWLCSNRQSFSELQSNDSADIFPNLYSASSFGIWLGGVRGKGYRTSLRSKYDFNTKR